MTRVAAPFTAWDGMRYGALGLPLAFVALPLYVVLPSHYAEQHGVSLATLGAVLLGTRALDAALDPAIGRAADALFAHSTRAALTVAASAAVLVALGFTALFHAPLEGAALLGWLAGGLIVTYLAFSVLTVVHQAWGHAWGATPASARAWWRGAKAAASSACSRPA